MLHPWQTDTFDPGAPALLDRVQAGQRLNVGFRIGGSAWKVDGERWMLLHHPYPHPLPYAMPKSFFMNLAYPMPPGYGEDHFAAMNALEAHWNEERRRLWALEPPQEPEPEPLPNAKMATAQKRPRPHSRRSPREHHDAIHAGAVPLPGLEAWVGFGSQR
jgi:hypothetical protein